MSLRACFADMRRVFLACSLGRDACALGANGPHQANQSSGAPSGLLAVAMATRREVCARLRLLRRIALRGGAPQTGTQSKYSLADACVGVLPMISDGRWNWRVRYTGTRPPFLSRQCWSSYRPRWCAPALSSCQEGLCGRLFCNLVFHSRSLS